MLLLLPVFYEEDMQILKEGDGEVNSEAGPRVVQRRSWSHLKQMRKHYSTALARPAPKLESLISRATLNL